MDSIEAFKAKYLTILFSVSRGLYEKYPNEANKVWFFVNLLVNKLGDLSKPTITEYLVTLNLAVREFREFEKLIPTQFPYIFMEIGLVNPY